MLCRCSLFLLPLAAVAILVLALSFGSAQNPTVVVVAVDGDQQTGKGIEPQLDSEAQRTMSAPTQDGTGREKIVYLIRHAESEENRRIGSLKSMVGTLGRFSMPKTSDLKASVGLLNVPGQVDSDVSPRGRQQIDQLGRRLKDDGFVAEKAIKVVAHSPLKRARQTSEGMLGCAAPDTKPPMVDRVEELESLREKGPIEWVPGNTGPLLSRITAFEKWVEAQQYDVLAVVGHSQYFKAMLGLDFKFGNCDVWEIRYGGENSHSGATDDGRERLPRKWSGLKQLYKYEES